MRPEPGPVETPAAPSGSVPPPAPSVPDPRRLRGALATFATGVTVVTVGGDSPHGMTANAFTSVSLDPPLILVCVKREARLHDSLVRVGGFGVSVLASHQERVARHFSRAERPRGIAQFANVPWSAGRGTGAPLLEGALAWLECLLWQVHEGGDHSVFLGRLVSVVRHEQTEPLVFFGGKFRQLGREHS